MKFKEEITKDDNGNLIRQYFINDKEVDEKTFMTLWEDFCCNVGSAKTAFSKTRSNVVEDEYCVELLKEIRNLGDDEALELLQEEIEAIINESFLYGQQVLLNNLGNVLLKQATRLEDYLEQFHNEDESE